VQEQLVKYLTDAHSIETQALAQLRTAPKIAGDPELSRIFEEHLHETEGHETTVQRSQPHTPGKIMAHAHSYEALEEAAYALLLRVAERAGDERAVEVARAIREDERRMERRIAENFDRSVEASLRDVPRDDLDEQLDKYLADAHAIEAQAIELLEKGPDIVGDPELGRLFEEHLAESREHQELVNARLDARGSSSSRVKDTALRAGALGWGMFFQAHPDTPGKLAAFAYAFEHLEIGAYEQLRRVAERAGDPETAQTADGILEQEREAAKRIAGSFDRAVDASLEAVGVR
jgi:ferritin-like metal-binding protein YciE